MLFSIYIQDTTLTNSYDSPCDSINQLFDNNFNLGIDNLDQIDYTISLYPNPSNGLFNLKNNANQLINKIEIFDVNGRLVYSSTLIQ